MTAVWLSHLRSWVTFLCWGGEWAKEQSLGQWTFASAGFYHVQRLLPERGSQALSREALNRCCPFVRLTARLHVALRLLQHLLRQKAHSQIAPHFQSVSVRWSEF